MTAACVIIKSWICEKLTLTTLTQTTASSLRSMNDIYTGWNDRNVALEKMTWFHFRVMKTGFLFLLQTIYSLASYVQIPRAIIAFYHVWKWHNVQRGSSDMRRCTFHVLYRSKLWQQDHCQHPQNANADGSTLEGTVQRIGRPFGRLRLWSLVWFQVRATSYHLTSSKSAWKSTLKCTWMCWRVWWSPGAIRWPVADPGCGSKTRRRTTIPRNPRLGFRRSATTLYPSLTDLLLLRPEPTELLRLVIRLEHHQHDLPQHQSQPDAAIRWVFTELPPALVEKACFQFLIEVVIEAEGRYIE